MLSEMAPGSDDILFHTSLRGSGERLDACETVWHDGRRVDRAGGVAVMLPRGIMPHEEGWLVSEANELLPGLLEYHEWTFLRDDCLFIDRPEIMSWPKSALAELEEHFAAVVGDTVRLYRVVICDGDSVELQDI